jgi:hypothetical protein
LILFRFIYPGETDAVPDRVRHELLQRAAGDGAPALADLCRGTLLSRYQYVVDIENWGYHDARLDSPPLLASADGATALDAA